MRKQATEEPNLADRIRRLPPDKVEGFVDFLAQRDDRRLVRAASRFSEKAFRRVWDNSDDAAYDLL